MLFGACLGAMIVNRLSDGAERLKMAVLG